MKFVLPFSHVVVAIGLLFSAGCVPMYDTEASLYAPGGALADKNEGPQILATATDASVAAMFPKGTPQSQVMQALGNPMSTSISDGIAVQMFSHSFTAYQAKYIQTESLFVEYDKKATVAKLTFSKSTNHW